MPAFGDPAPLPQSVVTGRPIGHHLYRLLHPTAALARDHLTQHPCRVVGMAHQIEVRPGVRTSQHHPGVLPDLHPAAPPLVTLAQTTG